MAFTKNTSYGEYCFSLRKKVDININKWGPTIKNVCWNGIERIKLSEGNPLMSLESFYFQKALVSLELYENRNWYSVNRNKLIRRYVKKHEADYFTGEKKPELIIRIENWCTEKKFSCFEEDIKSFQIACVLCENIIYWQKKSGDEGKDFIAESLELYLYDWLCCILEHHSHLNPIEQSLNIVRLKKQKKTEILKVTNYYLSLFVKLGFLHKVTNYATNLKPKYILGNVYWTIHQQTSVIQVFPFHAYFWEIKKTAKNLNQISIFENLIAFSPLKGETAESMQLKNVPAWMPKALLPIHYKHFSDFLYFYRKTKWKMDKDRDMYQASHLFYALDFFLNEYLDLVALNFYHCEMHRCGNEEHSFLKTKISYLWSSSEINNIITPTFRDPNIKFPDFYKDKVGRTHLNV